MDEVIMQGVLTRLRVAASTELGSGKTCIPRDGLVSSNCCIRRLLMYSVISIKAITRIARITYHLRSFRVMNTCIFTGSESRAGLKGCLHFEVYEIMTVHGQKSDMEFSH